MLNKNLTGGQIQEIMDFLIYKSIEPIIYNSNAFDVQIVYLIQILVKNKKRKLTSIPRETAISYLIKSLATEDPKKKLNFLVKASIERGFIHTFAYKVLSETKGFSRLYWQWLKTQDESVYYRMLAVVRYLGFSSVDSLYSSIPTIQDYLKNVYEYRNRIVDSYQKHVYKQAKNFIKSNPYSQYDLHDVVQSFLLSITKALDKYDSSKGALTSYIGWWLLNAQTCKSSNYEYGIAFAVPQNYKKTIAVGDSDYKNISVNYDDVATTVQSTCYTEKDGEYESLKDEEHEIVRKLAKKADIKGCARLFFDIEETFSEEELDRMRRHMKFMEKRRKRKKRK